MLHGVDEERMYAENDAHTLKEAGLIKKDEKRMKAAMEVMHESMEAMESMMEDEAKERFPGTYKKA